MASGTIRRNLMQLEKKELFLNLLSLEFHPQSLEVKHRCQFDENVFDKPNKRAFEVVAHFLFRKLNPQQAHELFRTCFPSHDKKTTQEFRRVCFNWLKRISEENPSFGLPKVSSTLLMSPGGKDFIHLMYLFSTFVLYKATTPLQRHGILYPLIILPKSRNLSHAQLKTLDAMLLNEFQRNQTNMQLMKKADEEMQSFAEEQVNNYHLLLKRKKLLLQKRAKSPNDISKYPETKKLMLRKEQKHEIDIKIKSARAKWKQLSNCIRNTKQHREIMESIIGENNKYKIDGNKLQPVVPAQLLDECQEEIYQTVGTSLYQEGKINLASLTYLGNLSLTVVADTLHDGCLPNFDKQIGFCTSQRKIHQEEMNCLLHVQEKIRKELKIKESTIKDTESALDAIYKSDGYLSQSNWTAGSDVPDFGSKSESLPHGISPSRSDEEPDELEEDCVTGIAARYLLPQDDADTFLERVVASADTATPKELVHESTYKSAKDNNPPFQAWTIPISSDRPTSAKKKVFSKSNRVPTKQKSTKSPVAQGRKKHVAFEKRISAELRKHLASSSLTPDGKLSRTPPKHRSRARKSLSLPSSPLTHYRQDDVVVEKYRSTTPLADQKLIEMIVDCTTEKNDPSTSLVVYHQDTMSQLERSAFVPRDKIARTPTYSPVPLRNDNSQDEGSGGWFDSSDDDESGPSPFPSSRNCSSRKRNEGYHDSPTTQSDSKHGSDDEDNVTEKLEETAPASSHASSLKTETAVYSCVDNSRDTSNVIDHMLPEVNDSRSALSCSNVMSLSHSSVSRSHSSNFGRLQLSHENSISSTLDSDLTSILEDIPPEIMDLRTLGIDDLESLEDEKVPVTDTLVSLDDNIIDVVSKEPFGGNSAANPIDLLMSTPPPLTDFDPWKENDATVSQSSCLPLVTKSTNQLTNGTTPDRPMLQEFQINLLPTKELSCDFQTPDLQRFRSFLSRDSTR